MNERDSGIMIRTLIVQAASNPSGLDDRLFADTAIQIASTQGRLNGLRPLTGTREGLDAIDPLPETAFKMMTVATFPPSEAVAEFLTSGTTSGNRGRLLVRDMDLYRLSAVEGFRLFAMYGEAPRRFLSLIPGASARPTSSLSWMADFVAGAFDDTGGRFVAADGTLDGGLVLDALARSRRTGEPLFLLGTSLDFLALFDFLASTNNAPIPAPGSRMMHTGGAKASGREITREDLRERAGALLGIREEDVIEEFGMTELFSQAYDSPVVTPGPRRLVPVPWMRTRVLDPRTLTDVPDGARGQLVHYDLANIDTCIALIAADTAIRIDNGFAGISRSAGAATRGCSHEAAASVTEWRT
ncbi:hypothetical protein KBA39_09145 [Myxococcota bacterium]|nr:hypothetical protein [Myxococcota bacterium]